MADVVQLSGADFDEAIAFLDGVFGEHRPHDFATLLPSIYQPCDELMSCNHALRVDGRIRAIVGLFPIDWQVGGRLLKVGGIGGVSTHPGDRGKGYMGVLMRHCVERMKAEGFHLSWLGGQRQRYGWFGYEKCGQTVSVDLGPANLRHACPTPVDLRFETLKPGHSGRLEQAWKMHQAQRVHCRRRKPWFHRYLRAWYNRPHAALDASGEMAGYLVASPDGDQVVELIGRDEETALAMAPAWGAGPRRWLRALHPADGAVEPGAPAGRRGGIGERRLLRQLAGLRLGGHGGGPDGGLRPPARGRRRYRHRGLRKAEDPRAGRTGRVPAGGCRRRRHLGPGDGDARPLRSAGGGPGDGGAPGPWGAARLVPPPPRLAAPDGV